MGFKLFALFLIVSCTHYNKTENSQIIEIKVKQLSNFNQWEINYKLPKPVQAFVFNRQTNQFRKKEWKILNNDLIITHKNNFELIKSKSGKSFDQITIRHDSYYNPLKKDYEFFIEYSDGDTLMYTGHYAGIPLQSLDDLENQQRRNNQPYIESYKFVPQQSVDMIIDGHVFQQNLIEWKDKGKNGTYVFWGQNKPIIRPNIIVLVDKKVPSWIRESIENKLPKIFEFYAKKLGFKLDFKPVVYINYTKRNNKKFSNSGGTLPGLIQMSFSGRDWKTEGKIEKEWLFWFLSHEAAHLWNSQMVSRVSDSGKQSWMHEGSADAFAYKALKEFNIISSDEYQKYVKKELMKCLEDIEEGFPLVEASEKRKFGAYYTCGHMIALLTEKTIPSNDIFSFWNTLLNEQKKKDGEYDVDDYFELWLRLASSTKIIKKTKNLVFLNSIEAKKLFQ